MVGLSTKASGAGGLGTRPARWVFLFMWACGVWLGFIDEYFTPLDPLNATAYAAGIAGGLLLTTPGPLPLSRARAVWLPVIALYIVVVALARAPGPDDIGVLTFAAYLVAFAIPRGNPVAGGVGSALVIGYALGWGMLHDATGAQLAALIGIPVGCVVAGVVWWFVLRWIVRQEHRHRSEAAQAAERAEASLMAMRASHRELAAVRREVSPLLERIIAGSPIDAETRVGLVRVEAAVRDRIRAPHLQHPDLVAAFAELRSREVTVVVLGEPTSVGEIVDAALISRILEVISDTREGRITVRSFPPGRRAAISIVLQGSQESEQILLSATGETISRG